MKMRPCLHLECRAILALLPDFLAQQQLEIFDSHTAHIRVKSLGATQQIINRRMTALEALTREASALQAESAIELRTMERQQNQLESSHSAIEAAISVVRRDLFCVRSAFESANRWECEAPE